MVPQPVSVLWIIIEYIRFASAILLAALYNALHLRPSQGRGFDCQDRNMILETRPSAALRSSAFRVGTTVYYGHNIFRNLLFSGPLSMLSGINDRIFYMFAKQIGRRADVRIR